MLNDKIYFSDSTMDKKIRKRKNMNINKINKYIKNEKIARIATVDNFGNPSVVPVWFFFKNDCIYFGSSNTDKKTMNIKTNSMISMVIDTGMKNSELQGVVINGKAQILPIKNSEINYSLELEKKYNNLIDVIPESRGKHIIIKITPENFVSWDYT